MKSLIVLALACLPLAVLTVSSFGELAAINGHGGSPDGPSGSDVESRTASAQAAIDKPLIKDLSETEFFGPERIAALESPPELSRLKAFGNDWSRWVHVCALVAGVLDAEQAAVGKDLAQLQNAGRQFEAIKAKHNDTPLKGSQPFARILDRRLADLKTRIAGRQIELEAATILEQARSTFASRRYEDCTRLCDQLLTSYLRAMDVSVQSRVRVLRERAQFWCDAEAVAAEASKSDDPARRKRSLEALLKKYPGREERTASEVRFLEQCKSDLDRTAEKIAAAERSAAGMRKAKELELHPPGIFADRAARAAAILVQSPDADVRASLRGTVLTWIAQWLPEKSLKEADGLREGRTKEGEIVRGFFKQVKSPDGRLIGYKRYPTLEAMLDPVSEVGTYGTEKWSQAPTVSLPRRCLTEYQAARKRLIDEPANPQSWSEMAALCEKLQGALNSYRRLPGASAEEVSFTSEATFARQATQPAVWDHLEKLLAP